MFSQENSLIRTKHSYENQDYPRRPGRFGREQGPSGYRRMCPSLMYSATLSMACEEEFNNDNTRKPGVAQRTERLGWKIQWEAIPSSKWELINISKRASGRRWQNGYDTWGRENMPRSHEDMAPLALTWRANSNTADILRGSIVYKDAAGKTRSHRAEGTDRTVKNLVIKICICSKSIWLQVR